MVYRHRQIGWVILGLTVPMLGVVLATGAKAGPALWIGVPFLVLVIVLFGCLTVTVDAETLTFRFGVGLIGRRIALSRITACRPVRNHWWFGWGIRWWGHGWLYNVSGLDAVEVTLDTGKRLRVGTDEPEALAAALGVPQRSGTTSG